MKTNIDFGLKRFKLRFFIGWYNEEDFVLFEAQLLRNNKDYFTFFQFQIAKFYIGFCYYKKF